jgi:hypothetical protein
MESGVFPRPEVVAELEKYIRVDLVTDRNTDQSRKNAEYLVERFQDATLPQYVILDSDGKVLDRIIGYTRDIDAFVRFLRR